MASTDNHNQTSKVDSSGSQKPSSRRRTFLKVAGASATTTLAGCIGGSIGGSSGGSDTFTVGAIYPLSGPLGEFGQSMEALCHNAAEVVNGKHDLGPLTLDEGEGLTNHNNTKVEVIVADHRADPGQGRSEAERLVQEENVDMLYGCYNSSVTATVSQVAERMGIPHVNGESSSPDLTERGLNWFWRTGPHDKIYTKNMFSFINVLNKRVDQPIETAAIIHEDTEYGAVSAEVQVNLCRKNNIELVAGPIAYTAKSISSFTSRIRRIKKNNPDVLFPTSYVNDAILMAEEMRKQNYMPPLILAQNSGHTSNAFVTKEKLSNYFCSRTDFTSDLPEQVPEMGKYRQFALKNTDIPASDFNALLRTWGGLLCGLTAANQAESFKPKDLQSSLNSLQMERLVSGLTFGIDFNENGQNKLASGVIGQFQDADSKLVWPPNLISKNPLVYPAPDFDER